MLLEDAHQIVVYYCWWTLLYGLAPMIWFYPLNELDITGYEAFGAVWLISILTVSGPVRRCLGYFWSLRALEVLMLVGILSFQMRTTLSRLMVLAMGNGAAILYFSANMFSGSSDGRWRHFWLLFATNLLFLSTRVCTTSLTPAWTSHHFNFIIATILLVSLTAHVMLRKTGFTNSPAKSTSEETTTGNLGLFRHSFVGVLFGAVLFLSHWIFGDLHVLSRWSVSGYPSIGPSPFHSAPIVLLALISGFILPSFCPKFVSSIYCWIVGTVAFFGTYYFDGYLGFGCGLILAAYCSVLWILTGRKLVICTQPGLVVTTGMLIYLACIFFHVWTVAFNFVPGGYYTREHSDYLIIFLSVVFLGALQRNLVEFKVPTFGKILFFLAIMIVILGSWNRLERQPKTKIWNENTRDFTAAIWTFHFGYDNKGWPSLERAADMLSRTDADVIALLESDASKPHLGHNDLAMWLSERLGMFVDFGPSTKDHTWGNLLLSKYPIISSTHHLLPSPEGELAPAVSATLNISGHLVDVISTHMGNDRDTLDRKLQTEYLSKISAASENSVVFLGYVTSAPSSRDYVHFTTKGGLKDIDDTDKYRWCEYIMYKNLVRQAYARISHGGLSDTELQLARFAIPRNLKSYTDNNVLGTDLKKLGSARQLTDVFGGWKDGHHLPETHNYHMATPKYFVRNK